MFKKYLFSKILVLFFLLLSHSAMSAGEDYGSYLVSSYALDKGDVQGASLFLKRYLKQHPEDIDNIRKGYLVMGMAGDIESAAFYALQDQGKDKMKVADLIIAINHAKNQNYTEARTALHEFAKNNKAITILSSFIEAWLLAGEEKFEEAIKVLEKTKNEPDLKSMYYLHKGMIYELAGDSQKSLENYELAAIQAHRLSAKGMQIIAKTLVPAGKTEDLIKAIDKHKKNLNSVFYNDYKNYILDSTQPSAFQGINDGLAEAFYGMGTLFFQAKSSELAELLYKSALVLSPDFYSLRLMFGELYEEAKDYSKANEMYRYFTLNSPFVFTSLIKQAKILMAQDENNSLVSQEIFQFLIDNNPNNLALLSNYAEFLKEQELFEQAVVYYSKVLNKIKNKDGSYSKEYWLPLFSRGSSYERLGLWDLAEKDLFLALELSPDNPYILNYIGYYWLDNGLNQEQAVAMIEKASKKMPYDGYIMDSLGWAYYMTGDYQKSQEALERALDILPDNSVVLNHLGDLYWKVGRKIEAEFQWKKALDMNKDLEDNEALEIEYKIQYGLDDFENNYEQK